MMGIKNWLSVVKDLESMEKDFTESKDPQRNAMFE
jgi:hypothetical protein